MYCIYLFQSFASFFFLLLWNILNNSSLSCFVYKRQKLRFKKAFILFFLVSNFFLKWWCKKVYWMYLTWSKKSLRHPAIKNGAFEPNIAPKKIRSKLCSHSNISSKCKRKHREKKNRKIDTRKATTTTFFSLWNHAINSDTNKMKEEKNRKHCTKKQPEKREKLVRYGLLRK